MLAVCELEASEAQTKLYHALGCTSLTAPVAPNSALRPSRDKIYSVKRSHANNMSELEARFAFSSP